MSRKILIIDDSKTMRQQVEFVLTKSGFDVIEGLDGEDGLKKLEENDDVKLVVCDVNMPGIDGIEIVKQLNKAGSNVPIVMLTTRTMLRRSKKPRSTVREGGSSSLLNKPAIACFG